LIVVWSATTVAVTATSCAPPAGVETFASVDGGVVALGTIRQQFSDNGGQTWRNYDGEYRVQWVYNSDVCLDDGRCYSVVNDQLDERRPDGDARTVVSFSAEEQRIIDFNDEGCEGAPTFGSLTAVRFDERDIVLVAMGSEGLLRYDTSDGLWSRIAVGDAEPTDLTGGVPSPLTRNAVALTPLVVALASPLLMLVRRHVISGQVRAIGVVIALIGGGVGMVIALLAFISFLASEAATFRMYTIGAIVAMAGLAVSVVTLLLARPPKQPAPPSEPPSRPPIGPPSGPPPPFRSA
jgi:hypothetical protein